LVFSLVKLAMRIKRITKADRIQGKRINTVFLIKSFPLSFSPHTPLYLNPFKSTVIALKGKKRRKQIEEVSMDGIKLSDKILIGILVFGIAFIYIRFY